MENPTPARNNNPAVMPYRVIRVSKTSGHMLHLPGGQRVISYSWDDGSFQVWDLEKGTQVGEKWEDKDGEVLGMALSPGGKTVATGNMDGIVKLWNIDTGKVIKTWTGHTNPVRCVCWNPDGGQVVSGTEHGRFRKDATFRVWDVESGKTNLGPINTDMENTWAVCYSPDGKMIATAGSDLKIWDANSGELLKTIKRFFTCLAWTSDGKTLIAGESKIDTATWAVLDMGKTHVNSISLSPNECILASTTHFNKTVQLWNLETNQLIGTPLYHEAYVNSVTFSADGRFLFTSCIYGCIYTWDLSAIVKEASFLLDIVSLHFISSSIALICSPG
jgi:WD40 repeat protein